MVPYQKFFSQPCDLFEYAYVDLLTQVQLYGVEKQTRNAKTKSLFGMSLCIEPSSNPEYPNTFPIIQGRKMYPKGILGEFAAMLRGPKTLEDFEKWGCNYWKQWAEEDGSINVDYGNAWIDWNGTNQIETLVGTLKNNPNDRRMIVSGWRPDRIKDQSLPCCHMLYQWYVSEGQLHMIWYQRSVDIMVGLPSDIAVAAVWNIMLANEVGLKPGSLTFMLGDCHIYEQHYMAVEQYKKQFHQGLYFPAEYKLNAKPGKKLLEFEPSDIELTFKSGPKVELEVLA